VADAGIGKKASVCSSMQVKGCVNAPKRFLTSFGMTKGERKPFGRIVTNFLLRKKLTVSLIYAKWVIKII